MIKYRNNQRGFTILELLIVIVVIGVLAALVLNAFGNAQAKARNAVISRTVKQYESALLQYHADHGSYPAINGNNINAGTCVGTGYKDRNNNGQGDCNLFTVSQESDSEFNDALKPYFSDALPPAGNHEVDPGNGNTWQGFLFAYSPELKINGNSIGTNFLVFLLEGNDQDCKHASLKPATSWPNFESIDTKNSGNFGTATACMFQLPE